MRLGNRLGALAVAQTGIPDFRAARRIRWHPVRGVHPCPKHGKRKYFDKTMEMTVMSGPSPTPSSRGRFCLMKKNDTPGPQLRRAKKSRPASHSTRPGRRGGRLRRRHERGLTFSSSHQYLSRRAARDRRGLRPDQTPRLRALRDLRGTDRPGAASSACPKRGSASTASRPPRRNAGAAGSGRGPKP